MQGSYIEFTGDMMNPTLNITAKERMKAVVSDGDQSRSVPFDVGIAITKPLNDMGLEFVIEAPEDLAVTTQLAAMTREQRGKGAVMMLAAELVASSPVLTLPPTMTLMRSPQKRLANLKE